MRSGPGFNILSSNFNDILLSRLAASTFCACSSEHTHTQRLRPRSLIKYIQYCTKWLKCIARPLISFDFWYKGSIYIYTSQLLLDPPGIRSRLHALDFKHLICCRFKKAQISLTHLGWWFNYYFFSKC